MVDQAATAELFDNTHVTAFPQWLADNHRALIRCWWRTHIAQRVARLIPEPLDIGENFDGFCRAEHGRALAIHEAMRSFHEVMQ